MHYTTILSLFLLTTLSSCLFMGPSVKGNGEVVEKVREVEPFRGIYVTSGMNVHLVRGDQQKVVVVADANLHEVIRTEVEDGILEIKAQAGIWKSKENKVMVTTPELEELTGTAGSNIFTDTLMEFRNIRIRGSAGSNLRLEINGERAEISASAGSNIFLDGTFREVEARVSSGANIKAGNLTAGKSNVRASSGGNLWMTVKEELTASASSGGNIFYSGSPGIAEVSSSSGGNIIKKN